MSLAASALPVSPSPAEAGSERGPGILVIEASARTPLGPRIVFANEAASKISGYDLSSLIGSPLGLIYDHADLGRLIAKLPLVAESPDFCWMNRILIGNGGTRKPVRWTIRPTQRGESSLGYFTLTLSPANPAPAQEELALETIAETAPEPADPEPSPASRIAPEIRETRQIEEERRESLALAAGGVAHDFKNALQAIKSNLEMAREVAGPNDRLGDYLSDAHLALYDAEVLARQMLDFTRGGTTRRCVFDVGESLKRVSRLSTAGSRIRCRLRIPSHLRPVEGDPDQIYQVLHNLVINACQAMPNGGTIDLSAGDVDLGAERNHFAVAPGNYTVLSVRDRGIGIDRENLQRIFDRNFSTKEGGCGFGLASCRAIVERHGGAIRVASRIGVGTEFLVFLPSSTATPKPAQLPDSRAAESPGGRADAPARPSTGNARILVVEDQQGVRKATCGMLRHLGYETLVAEDGEQAIAIYRRFLDSEEPVHAVLLDMTLPGGLCGREVFAELLEMDERVVVIATSGYFEEGPSAVLEEEGFAGVIAKPFSMDSLAITVHEALAR